MKTRYGMKLISLVLTLSMVISMLPVTVLAAELDEQAQTCTHHPEHTAECGYAEAVEAAACTHRCSEEAGCVIASCTHTEHDDTCGYTAATEGSPCTHLHDDDCGYSAGAEECPCTHVHDESCGWGEDAPCSHTHDEDCGYAEAVEESPCSHTHDEDCGYTEAAEGTPCTHQCGGDTGCVEAVCAHTTHDDDCGYVEGREAQPCTFVCEECTQQILYSDLKLAFSQTSSSFSEGDGSRTVTLTRSGDTSEALEVTVLAYDNSANYGEDYQISYNGELVPKNEGATSVYDAFRDYGELTSGALFDLNTALAQVEELQSGEEQEDVSAADMLEQLDDLGVQAAAIPVTFAAGETAVTLTIEILDDAAGEYEETFLLAVLDAEGEAVETAQQVVAIEDDDEPAPSVSVAFDCEAELELDLESGEAELVFCRTGDLATATLTALCLDGEPMGWVDFAPWQEIQTVWVLEAGIYTLLDADGYPVNGQQVTVVDNRPTETSAPEEADPVLDAVPEEYAALPRSLRAISTSWLPAWATGSETTDEDSIIILGTTSNNLYKKGGNTSKGSASFFVDGYNVHDLNTSGTGSRLSTGYLFLDSNATYDFTGVESISSIVYPTGVDGEATLCLGVSSTVRANAEEITAGSKAYPLTATLPDKFQGTKGVYYGNTDPNKSSGGCHMYVPNGFKMNLRQYRFIIEDSTQYVDALNYTGGSNPGDHAPTIVTSKKYQTMTINSKTYGANKTVDIVYSCDSQYPARLAGYRLRNYDTGALSSVICLPDGGDGTGGTAGFTFDTAFLKSWEDKYCTYTHIDGIDGENVKVWTFHVIPVYEKIPVNSYEIWDAPEGTVQLVSTGTEPLYRGDIAVFEDTATQSTLSGVWYQAKGATGDTIKEQAVSQTHYGSATSRFQVSLLYNRYTFQGVYSADATQLLVYYADGASDRGKLDPSGQIVAPSEYVVGDYVPLTAEANSGYVTRWESNGRYFYGNVFYYQLDGNPDHNTITVDFVQESTVTDSALTGVLYRAETELRLGSASYVPMANTEITIVADQEYEVTTDANGAFSIANFTGVVGKTYSVSLKYASATGYTTFTYLGNTSDSYEFKLPQFAVGTPYPDKVTATVNGIGSSQNMLTLDSGGLVGASVRVYVPPKNYEITGVNVYFLTAEQIAAGSTAGLTSYAAAYSSTSGDYQTWTVSDISADNLASGTQLYVVVEADKTIYSNGTETETVISSGLVNGGYQLTTPNLEYIVSVVHDVPETPGLQNASSIDLSDLNIPVIGNLDFSLSSKTGGFFTQRTDSAGNLTLICGSSYLADFATGPVSEKYQSKKKTKEYVEEKKKSKSLSDQPTGGANPGVAAAIPGEAMTGNGSASNKTKAASNWSFSPAFLFKITLSPGTTDSSEVYVSAYEMALGVDAFYKRNFPASISGFPVYICLTFTTEAYFDLQVAFQDDQVPIDKIADALFGLGTDSIKDTIASTDSFIAAPVMQFGAKGGAGYNGFLSVFLEAIVNVPFIIDLDLTGIDAAAQLSFTVNGGADLVVFTGKVGVTLSTDPFGNEELINDLTTITGLANASTVSTMSLRSAAAGDASSVPDVEELLNELTFSAMSRTAGLRQSSAASGTVASSTFKNTGVHLLQLDEDTIMAFFLVDNREEDTLNYLTAACAISEDGGETWGDVQYISDNTQQSNTSLQFDINLFQLEDRTLVTWSEANFDEILENLDDIDVNELTPAQISKFMNAMNLKGRFFDRDGDPMGEAFTIAENSTVACGAIDAVQNGDMVYVYYQRNVFPEGNDGSESVTLADLLATERTVALARADVSDTSNWISTPVRAENENGQQYRITDVEPFVHDGVMGEILVLDRGGMLAEWNETTGTWDPSVEDRQLYLRTYDFAEDGTPEPTALMAITSAQDCAQSPEVVSNGDYLHLFWNQNGSVVYISDFVATSNDHADVQDTAYVLKNADGTVAQQNKNSYTAYDIASDESFHVGTKFTASMDADGNVLLSWISTDTEDQSLLPTEEIYGVMLETITNATAANRSGGEVTEGNENLYQLYAKGAPVALTDEDSLIGALDSLCLSDSSFLLAFSKLNRQMRSKATAADILTVQSENAPKLEITSVSAPQYPMPGSDMTVYVTVENKGLGAAENVTVTASGVGSSTRETISLQSGRSTTVELTVAVPEDFSSATTLSVTAQTDSTSASSTADILYGPYFTISEMPVMSSVAGTSDCWTETYVYNAGNAAGKPELTFKTDLFAVDDEAKTYTYTSKESVAPGGAVKLTYLLENTTLLDGTSTLTVSLGDGADQRIQGRMPAALTAVNTETTPDTPDTPSSSGGSGSASYTVTVEDTDHGTVTVTPKSASKGTNVTITVEPDKGYTLETLTVTDKNGDTVTLTKKSDSQYTFTMPSGKVNIKATFMEDNTILNYFTDVFTSNYYYDAVLWAAENGITGGTSSTTFSPGASCTRAQAVTFLWRNAGSPEPESDGMPFTDVAPGAYYYDAVLWAVEQGITTGTTATTFSPNATCTRAQIVTFLWRSEGSAAAATENPFTDVPADAYYVKAVLWAVENGITTGTTATTFSPNDRCTRAQIVTFLYRCFQ